MNRNIAIAVALAIALAAPFVGYPVFLMKLLCFGLFACAFNLLIGYTGLLSFGHAAFFGSAGYVTGHALTALGLPTEVGILLGVGASGPLQRPVGRAKPVQLGLGLDDVLDRERYVRRGRVLAGPLGEG